MDTLVILVQAAFLALVDTQVIQEHPALVDIVEYLGTVVPLVSLDTRV